VVKEDMNTIKKIFKGLCVSVLVFVFCCVAIDQFVALSADRYIDVDELPNSGVVLVLGARVTPQKKPSDMLADRLDRALEVYNSGYAQKILVSGDHGSLYYNEVGVMKAYLVERGVPEGDIFMDHAGFSTYESMVRAKEIFGVKELIISTQGYHLKRAVYIARVLGMDAYGVSADQHFYPSIAKYRSRELLARVKDFMYVHVMRPDPTYLGDPISMQGSSGIDGLSPVLATKSSAEVD